MAQDPTSHALRPAQDLRLLLSTVPPGQAEALARTLVDEGLAACVNLVPGLRSLYRWQGQGCDDPETLLVLKTSHDRVADLARRLCELHPYEVPELLAFTPEQGLAAYVAWVQTQTHAPD